jgi:putative ABC transport system permease protein
MGLRRLVRRLRILLFRGRVEEAMGEELRYHLDCEISERIAAGMPPDEARRTALRDFGGIEATKEAARDARGGRAVEDFLRDVGYAIRVLRRDTWYTAAAVATFALGVGATTTIISLVYGVLLRPLPYAQPERLVVVWERNVPKDHDTNVVSLDNYEAWSDRAHAFAAMSAIVPTSVTFAGGSVAERLVGADITAGFFSRTLGVAPAIGRDFVEADSRDGGSVILSDAIWKGRFNGDPSLVGRAVILSGKPYTVVGVMPPTFDPPRLGWLGEQHVWFPFVATPQARSWGRFLIVIARLAPGATVEQARVEMLGLAAQREQESTANQGWSASVVPLPNAIIGDMDTSLLVLLASVMLLLFIAVTNVATLTLAATRRRVQELAIRRALGATDRRLFGQLFTQGALLGALGTLAGSVLAVPAVDMLVTLLPADMPRAGDVHVDVPVLVISSTIAFLATTLFGFASARQSRNDGRASLVVQHASEGRTIAPAGGGLLVGVEIALAVALGVMAMLTARTFTRLSAVDLGFRPAGVVAARLSLPPSYATAEARRLFFERLVERVGAIPGAQGAGIISTRPFDGLAAATTVHDAMRPAGAPGEDPVADVRYADAHAFAALGIPFQHGASFDDRNRSGPIRVVISETLARAVWPDRDPIGRTLFLQLYGGVTATVSGVVRDVRLMDARTAPSPVAYLPASRFPDSTRDLIVRVAGDPAAVLPSLRAAAASLDSSIPLFRIEMLSAKVGASLARDRLTMLLLAGFAVAALLLAGVGVFGVCAGDVALRGKEVGIRVALGARRSDVIRRLLLHASRRLAIGVAGGLFLALAAGRSMTALLFGVTFTDPLSLLVVLTLVIALGIAATLLPAWQALRQSPLEALREQ